MEKYIYVALDEDGKRVKGSMKANSPTELQARLKEKKLYLKKAKTEKKTAFKKRIRQDRISDFSRNLGKLMMAGIPMVKALKVICEDENIGKYERQIYSGITKEVMSGTSISEAMAEQGDAFPQMLINMFRAAEISGNFSKTAMRMADYYDKEYRLKRKINGALLYPKILLVLMVAVLMVILGYVIPQFKSLFAEMGQLPATTRLLLFISSFISNNWVAIIIAIVFAVTVLRILVSIPALKYHADKLKLKVPVFSRIQKVLYTARFSRTLSGMYSVGIPMLTCLNVSASTIDNSYIEAQFDGVIADIKSGAKLSEALGRVDGFSKKMISSVTVGEETGALDEMLISISSQLEYDSEVATQKLVSALEPVMIVVMAVIIGFIMISIIQPIYGSYENLVNTKL